MESNQIPTVIPPPPNANGLAHRKNPVHPLGGPPKGSGLSQPRTPAHPLGGPQKSTDSVHLGGKPLSQNDSMRVILENAYGKIRGVVDDAKASLGIEPGAAFDSSSEATAMRIADFALNFFAQYQANNPEVEGQAAREQYAQFIGEAIAQGISEARGILDALSAIDGETENGISTIESLIQQRLDAFVAGE